MLETLRAYGLERLADAGERPEAAAALARYALQVAEQAAAALETSAGEQAAALWLDAEDAAMQQALTWALDHDHATALRLALALAPWWWLRGRWASGYQLLTAAAGHAAAGGKAWCAAQYWLGMLTANWDVPTSFGHLTAARDALAGRAPVPLLAHTLAWRAGDLANLDRFPEAAEEARRALAIARELGDRRRGSGRAVLARDHSGLRGRLSRLRGLAAAGPADRPGSPAGMDHPAGQPATGGGSGRGRRGRGGAATRRGPAGPGPAGGRPLTIRLNAW